MAESGFTYVLERILKPAGVKVGGFPEELFIDITSAELEEWQCNVCYMVANDARECKNQHVFCAACVFAWSMTGSANCDKCPVCRVDGNSYKESDKHAAIQEKRVKCLETDCTYKGPLKFFVNHHSHGKVTYHNDDLDWVPIFSEFEYQHRTESVSRSPLSGMTLPPLFDLTSMPLTDDLTVDSTAGLPPSTRDHMRMLSLERLAMIEHERRRRQSRFHHMRRQMVLGRVLLQHMISEMQVDLDQQREGSGGTNTEEERLARMQEIRELSHQIEEIGMILSILMINVTPVDARVRVSGGVREPSAAPPDGLEDPGDESQDESLSPRETFARVLSSNRRLDDDTPSVDGDLPAEHSRRGSTTSATSYVTSPVPQATPSSFFFNDRSNDLSMYPRRTVLPRTPARLLDRPSETRTLVASLATRSDDSHVQSDAEHGSSTRDVSVPGVNVIDRPGLSSLGSRPDSSRGSLTRQDNSRGVVTTSQTPRLNPSRRLGDRTMSPTVSSDIENRTRIHVSNVSAISRIEPRRRSEDRISSPLSSEAEHLSNQRSNALVASRPDPPEMLTAATGSGSTAEGDVVDGAPERTLHAIAPRPARQSAVQTPTSASRPVLNQYNRSPANAGRQEFGYQRSSSVVIEEFMSRPDPVVQPSPVATPASTTTPGQRTGPRRRRISQVFRRLSDRPGAARPHPTNPTTVTSHRDALASRSGSVTSSSRRTGAINQAPRLPQTSGQLIRNRQSTSKKASTKNS